MAAATDNGSSCPAAPATPLAAAEVAAAAAAAAPAAAHSLAGDVSGGIANTPSGRGGSDCAGMAPGGVVVERPRSAAAADMREARRQRILARGKERLKFITGDIGALPSTPPQTPSASVSAIQPASAGRTFRAETAAGAAVASAAAAGVARQELAEDSATTTRTGLEDAQQEHHHHQQQQQQDQLQWQQQQQHQGSSGKCLGVASERFAVSRASDDLPGAGERTWEGHAIGSTVAPLAPASSVRLLTDEAASEELRRLLASTFSSGDWTDTMPPSSNRGLTGTAGGAVGAAAGAAAAWGRWSNSVRGAFPWLSLQRLHAAAKATATLRLTITVALALLHIAATLCWACEEEGALDGTSWRGAVVGGTAARAEFASVAAPSASGTAATALLCSRLALLVGFIQRLVSAYEGHLLPSFLLGLKRRLHGLLPLLQSLPLHLLEAAPAQPLVVLLVTQAAVVISAAVVSTFMGLGGAKKPGSSPAGGGISRTESERVARTSSGLGPEGLGVEQLMDVVEGVGYVVSRAAMVWQGVEMLVGDACVFVVLVGCVFALLFPVDAVTSVAAHGAW